MDQTEDEDPFMTEEWISEMCHSDDDVPVRVKCTRCGHEENVPRWLVAVLMMQDLSVQDVIDT